MKYKNHETGEEYALEYWQSRYCVRDFNRRPQGEFVRCVSKSKQACLDWLAEQGAVLNDTRTNIL